MRLLVFGGSIGEGFYDLENGGWVNRLKIKLWSKNINVSNCAISAYSSKNILNIFNPFFSAYSAREKGKEKETIVIFSIGTNDASLINGSYKTSPNIFRKNLIYLLDMCNANKIVKKVFFLTCLNCDEKKTNPVSWTNQFYKNDNLKKYNTIIKEVCNENNREFFDIFGLLEDSDFYDGLHPNSLGHEKIFKKVYDFLKTRI